MIVIDDGVVITLLLGGLGSDTLSEDLAAPHLIDSEVTHALRRMVLRRDLSEAQGQAAIESFVALAFTRHGIGPLRLRMWELRHNVTGYDSSYVALAEHLSLPLLTTDRKLAAAPGLRCQVLVV